ncbi:putative reverse transcriptase domain-containing protein [Tanacetum coccineum]
MSASMEARIAEHAATPLPPTSPAYDQVPLGHRAAMIRMRDDIPEEDMPPRRRFVLTAPPPGCDVAESSVVAAAARSPRGQYDFVDIVEAGKGLICSPGYDAQTVARAADKAKDVGYVRALQASEHRLMTSIEEVNLRVSYQAQVRMQESEDFYTQLHDARTHRRDIRLKIDVVKGQMTAYETELHEVCQDYLSSEARNKALLACLETLETHISRMEWQRRELWYDAVDRWHAQGRAYALGGRDASPDSNVITGTFLFNNRYAIILFDIGTDRSFVSNTFSALINITPTTLESHYDVELADGKIIGVNTIIHGFTLNFMNHPFNIDLMPVPLGSFDVIIGMDWLTKYHGVIICDDKIVQVLTEERCYFFMAWKHQKEAKDKSEGKRLEDVPIVRDFPEVFPKTCRVISPARQVEFQFDFVPGAAPVARAPYRLAPSKIKELAEQLQELSDKEFIRPSFSP